MPIRSRMASIVLSAFAFSGVGSLQACSPGEGLTASAISLADPATDAQGMDPGAIVRAHHGPTGWGNEWWLALAGAPSAEPEEWWVVGRRARFSALVVRGDGPVAVLLPHLQGTDRMTRFAARAWSSRGFQVIGVLPPPDAGALSTPDAGIELLLRRVREGRLAVHLARRELPHPCTLVAGVSVGGIVAVPVAALEPGLAGAVLMLAGGDLAWIASHTEEPLLQHLRDDPGDPAEDAAGLARVDPLTWAPHLDPTRTLMVRALWDRVIPAPATRALRTALGAPDEHLYPTGHYSFGYVLPVAMGRAIEHARGWCDDV